MYIWRMFSSIEYYSEIKKNEIMSLAATRMDLEIVMLSEASQTEKEKYPDTPCMRNLKRNYITELTCKTQTHRPKCSYGCQGAGWGEGIAQGAWDGHGHTAAFKMDNHRGPTIRHRELCSASRGRLDGGEFGRE